MSIADIQRKLSMLSERLSEIEEMIRQARQEARKRLDQEKHQAMLLNHGIQGFMDRIAKDCNTRLRADPRNQLYARMRADTSLRFPHRKILDYLCEQYDPQENTFQEIHFSELVRRCRLAKDRAKSYLEFLINRGFVKRREDGYRVWYGLTGSAESQD